MSAHSIAQGIGYLTPREVDCIKLIAERLPEHPLCVNIGSGAGTSVLALYEARADAKIVDIDINPENGIAQLTEAGALADPRYQRLLGASQTIEFHAVYDYLFIDGDHTEDGIRGDLGAWLWRGKPKAFLLVHDYWPYPADHELAGVDYWPDVRRVCDELMAGFVVIADIGRIRVYQL